MVLYKIQCMFLNLNSIPHKIIAIKSQFSVVPAMCILYVGSSIMAITTTMIN